MPRGSFEKGNYKELTKQKGAFANPVTGIPAPPSEFDYLTKHQLANN
jgi:hypothetical protein